VFVFVFATATVTVSVFSAPHYVLTLTRAPDFPGRKPFFQARTEQKKGALHSGCTLTLTFTGTGNSNAERRGTGDRIRSVDQCRRAARKGKQAARG
ncbi:hypothetical protein NL54_00005, partial [Pantoea stewartii]